MHLKLPLCHQIFGKYLDGHNINQFEQPFHEIRFFWSCTGIQLVLLVIWSHCKESGHYEVPQCGHRELVIICSTKDIRNESHERREETMRKNTVVKCNIDIWNSCCHKLLEGMNWANSILFPLILQNLKMKPQLVLAGRRSSEYCGTSS